MKTFLFLGLAGLALFVGCAHQAEVKPIVAPVLVDEKPADSKACITWGESLLCVRSTTAANGEKSWGVVQK